MKSRLILLSLALLLLLSFSTGCGCAPPDVDFDKASNNVKQWVEMCLEGRDGSGLWSAAYSEIGKAECSFLHTMNTWPLAVKKIVSVEDRASFFCSKDLWVFLEREDGEKGYLIVYVANANTSKEVLGIIPRSELDVVLIGVAYGPFCFKPTDDAQREYFEYCFWGSAQ